MSELALQGRRIWVAGASGLVGSALVRRLRGEGAECLLTPGREALDLTDQGAVDAFVRRERPEVIFLAAARVGGIQANDRWPADFLRDNLEIATHVIHAAWAHGARKLCFLGSSCVYPKHAPQPITEGALLSGPLEPTNQWYAVAKIAGIKLCQAYRRQHGFDAIALMPTNLYGPHDNFDPETSHVLPALIRRFDEAREAGAPSVTLWGTGTPRREFLHVDDLADAAVFLTRRYSEEAPVNVGTGQDLTILELAGLVARVVGFEGEILIDPSRPDGTPRKLLDVSRLKKLGWQPKIELTAGIEATWRWYRENRACPWP